MYERYYRDARKKFARYWRNNRNVSHVILVIDGVYLDHDEFPGHRYFEYGTSFEVSQVVFLREYSEPQYRITLQRKNETFCTLDSPSDYEPFGNNGFWENFWKVKAKA